MAKKNVNHLWFLFSVILAGTLIITVIVAHMESELTLSKEVGSVTQDWQTIRPMNLRYLSSRGLRSTFTPNHEYKETDEPSTLGNSNIIHLSAGQVGKKDSWLKHVQKIKGQVTIVSNDGDESIGPQVFEFLNSDKCKAWFSQNVDLKHPKLVPVPIGLDLHTRMRTESMSAAAQEDQLIQIRNSSLLWKDRKPLAHASFQFSDYRNHVYGYDRKEALEELNKDVVMEQPVRMPREQMWKEQSECKFVISPMGNGKDCHRTFEALVLGSVPIVKRHPKIDSYLAAYDKLPVLIVDSWKDVTPELLESYVIPDDVDWNRLTMAYWVDRIRSA